ncbi:MAG TPA: ABC transporter permease [Blastocatellia bacterium]|nr:ABC transporter permease [Blastocatellia bacterium]
MDTLLRDLRYAIRMLAKRPGFTVIAVLTLAIGIGATTAIFSVVNAVLLRPLDYKEPDRLLTVWENHEAREGPKNEWTSPPNFGDWRDQNNVLEGLAALQGWGPTLTGGAEPEMLNGAAVSHDMFQVLGVEPAMGRSFRAEEDRAGAERVVILGHGVWKRRFGGDEAILTRPITLNGEAYTVVGVMPEGFRFPIISNAEAFVPLMQIVNSTCDRGCYTLRTIGRLKQGITVEQARADMGALAAGLAEKHPDVNIDVGITLVPLHEQVVGSVKPMLLVLLGAVGFVLLIACANVANLMLARAATRAKEIAIRTALGASRARLIRQLLTESLILSLIAGALGLLLAFWLVDVMIAFSPTGTPRIDEVAIDKTVLVFTLIVAVATGLIFGLVPALETTRPDFGQSLKEGKGTDAASGGKAVRNTLVVVEVALALMLLIGAGLLIKSFAKLLNVDPGFNPSNVLTLQLNLPRTRYPEGQHVAAFYADLIGRVKNLPGVESVAAASSLPLGGPNTDASFFVEGRPAPSPGEEPAAWYSLVTADYFRTMGMRMVSGRAFDERDHTKSPQVIVINETMARRYWPGEDPVGKRVITGSINNPNRREVVGVIADVKHFGIDADARPTMYFSHAQIPARLMTLTVRTNAEPTSLATAVRSQVSDIDKELAVSNISSMQERVATSIAPSRLIMLLLGLFAGLALLLAAVGIYSVIAYGVTQRTREIGIRMALGAQAVDVLKLIVGQGMTLALIGVAIGLGLAVALTRFMQGLLYEVDAFDPVTFAAISLLLVGVALLACYIPARRAAKVDPMVALRYE